jgi:hypothetical protein
MAYERFRCRYCGKLKLKRTRDQHYCRDEDCQKARKNSWRRQKYQTDPDYRLNLLESRRAWLEAIGGCAAYYRQYRKECKERREKGRKERRDNVGPSPPREEGKGKSSSDKCQIISNDCGLADLQRRSANSDAFSQKTSTISGRYKLIPQGGANSDAFLAEITIISGG